MKKLIILLLIFCCCACVSQQNLKSINTETISTQVQINDTVILNETSFYDYCKTHSLKDWYKMQTRNYENNNIITIYTTFYNDSIYTLEIKNKNYTVIKKYLTNIK